MFRHRSQEGQTWAEPIWRSRSTRGVGEDGGEPGRQNLSAVLRRVGTPIQRRGHAGFGGGAGVAPLRGETKAVFTLVTASALFDDVKNGLVKERSGPYFDTHQLGIRLTFDPDIKIC